MRVTVTLQTPARALDVLVDCDESGPAAELERRLRALAGAPDAPMVVPRGGPTTLDGGIPTGRGTVADLGLLDGSRIGFLGADVSPPRLGRGLQLHVVSGPDSGAVLPLPAGTHEIGRSGALSWADHSLSRRHCRVGVTSVAVTVTDLGSSNGTAIDGRACPPQVPVSWRQGESLEVGDSLCELRVGAAAAALTEPAAPGWLRLQRPPRVRGAAHPLVIDLPPAPRGRGWRGGRAGPSDLGDDVRRLLREAVLQEQKEARGLLPDPASTVATVLQHGRRLWERRPEDDDFLVLRVGTGPRPAGMELRGGTPADRPWLRDVPVAVSLRGTPVLGVAGPGAVGDAVLRWLLLQLCAAHAPGDLGLTVLSTRADEAWSWLRWLPHLRPAGPASGAARVGGDPSGHQARLGDLLATVRRRRAGERGAAHVVVVHGHRALADAPGGSAALTELLRDGPSVGVHAVCVDEREADLPERCSATLLVDAAQPSYAALARSGQERLPRVRLEGVAPALVDRAARRLSPVLDPVTGPLLPERVRLRDLLPADALGEAALARAWDEHDRGDAAGAVPVGVGGDGPVDLDPLAPGAHTVVAGLPGTGRTAALLTMAGAATLSRSPDALAVVLVDGGAAAPGRAPLAGLAALAGLPHARPADVAAGEGPVRAAEAALRTAREVLVVVDDLDLLESASPGTAEALAWLAGRDPRLHLLAATGRPRAVPAAVRSVVTRRVALRLDEEGSLDLLGTTAAAALPAAVPGRALVAGAGAGEARDEVAVQLAWVGGQPPGAAAVTAVVHVQPLDWWGLGRPVPDPPRTDATPVRTDLDDLVDAVDAAARFVGGREPG
ncbi:FHA domain-containing protein [Nocardioides sp. Leaf374]|uniref:FHA domain-containing protein n=1 Tax=Nocardioides sp. Leaf374 TaxID=2876560 RepID=UPI001E53928D|nr:FHA domain-containing protein [Nocardioides sp. Leaf374]